MSEVWIGPRQEAEEDVFVEAGYAVKHPSGICLIVTEDCAAAMGGKLYQTVGWRERTAARKAMWENRSWWRKALNMSPKGWPRPDYGPGPLVSIGTILLGDLFG